MGKILQKQKLALLIVFFLATFLRLWKISEIPVSLFGDEMDVGYHAYSILKTGRDYQGNFLPLHFHSLAEWRTPLYLYAAVPTVAIFGISPLGVRLPAVFFGVLGVWGMYLLVNEYLRYGVEKSSKLQSANYKFIAIVAAFVTATAPWHLQYSRAGFEVTMLLAFLLFGVYFFLRSLSENGRWLWLSVLLLTLTPWVYSTAKLFTPILFVFLFLVWRKEILGFSLKTKLTAVLVGLIVGVPIAISTIWGGGAQRASYTSVFTDPTVVHEVGTDRLRDISVRGEAVLGAKPTVVDRAFHNKFVMWTDVVGRNFYQALSFDFLFNEGDPNPRHSPIGIGQFYKVEVIGLIVGLLFLFVGGLDRRVKLLTSFWILAGTLPAALTRDGGNHATRLILILPPLVFLVAYGLVEIYQRLNPKLSKVFLVLYSLVFTLGFLNYLHTYYVHYPWDSERWWHYGFKEAVSSIKEIEYDYDRIIISMKGEPAWIFFAGAYEYPPDKWQSEFPLNNKHVLPGFGEVSYIDKYYFGGFNVPGQGIYDLGNYLDAKTLYLAPSSEVGINLVMEPERTPSNLKLIDEISYPSGEPAFYLFSGK